jgi:hypothetical protein
MCTTQQRDEIIAEILVAHTGMPRGYASWFVRQLDATERSFVARAAISQRKSLIRDVQKTVHRRRALDRCFPENLVELRRPGAPRIRRRHVRSSPGQSTMF